VETNIHLSSFIYLFIIINKLVSFILKYLFYFVIRLDAATLSAKRQVAFSLLKVLFSGPHIPVWLIHFFSGVRYWVLLSGILLSTTEKLLSTVWQVSSAVRRIAFRRQHVNMIFQINCFHCQAYYFAQSELMRSAVRQLASAISQIVFYRQTCYFPQYNVLLTTSDILFSHYQLCFCLPWDMLHYFPPLHISDKLLSAVRHVAFRCQTCSFPLSDMSLSAVRHVAFRRQTCRFPLSDMSLSAVRHVPFRCQTCRFPLSDMSLSAVRHVAFRCQTCRFPLSDMLLSAVRHVAFRCQTWRFPLSDMSLSAVRHVAFCCQTCRFPLSGMTPIGRFSRKKY
jgi:hypothetical protein